MLTSFSAWLTSQGVAWENITMAGTEIPAVAVYVDWLAHKDAAIAEARSRGLDFDVGDKGMAFFLRQ